MNTQNLSTLKIHKLTQEQYDRELNAGRIDPNALYLTPNEEVDLSEYATVEMLQAELDKKPDNTDITNAVSSHNSGSSSHKDIRDTISAHTDNTDIHFTATERTKLSGIETGAQKNTVIGVKGNSESTYRTGNINITKTNIGLGNVDNTADANKPVSTAQQTAIDTAKGQANAYTDEKIALLLNNSSTAVDSIMELAQAMADHEEVTEALEAAIGNKADKGHSHAISDVTDLQTALDEIDAEIGSHTHDDLYYTETEIDTLIDNIPAVLTTAQELTDEQRAQARANISQINNWHTVKYSIFTYMVADYSSVISPSSAFNCELANTLDSVTESGQKSLGVLAYYANNLANITSSTSFRETAMARVFEEYVHLLEAGALASKTLYLCYKEGEDVGLIIMISETSASGYTHIYQINGFSDIHSTSGHILWNNNTKQYNDKINRRFLDNTLTQKTYYAGAKAVGDALALKIDKDDIATDDEILEMLTEVDMLPVVADGDGSILTDENDEILLW